MSFSPSPSSVFDQYCPVRRCNLSNEMQFDGGDSGERDFSSADADAASDTGAGAEVGEGLEGLLAAVAGCRALEQLMLSDNRLVGRDRNRMRSDWPVEGGAVGEGDVRYIAPLAAAVGVCGRCDGGPIWNRRH